MDAFLTNAVATAEQQSDRQTRQQKSGFMDRQAEVDTEVRKTNINTVPPYHMCINICLSCSQSNLDVCQVSKRLSASSLCSKDIKDFICVCHVLASAFRFVFTTKAFFVCKGFRSELVRGHLSSIDAFPESSHCNPILERWMPFLVSCHQYENPSTIQAKQRDRYCKLERVALAVACC